MKKSLLGLVLASFALFSVAQARFFIGVEGGYAKDSLYLTDLKPSTLVFSLPGTQAISNAFSERGSEGFSVKGVLGSESFLGNYFGSRFGLSVGYTSTEFELKNPQVGHDGGSKDKIKFPLEFVDVGLFTDLMLNFFNNGNFSFGIFGGVGADYHYELDWEHHFFDFSGRVGVSTLLAKHHRLEVMATLPIASLNIASATEALLGSWFAPARTTVGASYKFVF